MRIQRRPSRSAATPVVPLPAYGSRTRSPGRLEAATIRSSRRTGFWVGYPVRSREPGATMDGPEPGQRRLVLEDAHAGMVSGEA